MTTVTRPIHFRVRQTRRRIVTEPAPPPPPGRVPRVARLMALAIKFDRMLQDGVVGSQTDLAALARVTQPRITQIMNLLHLAPDIQEEILFLPPVTEGRDPLNERLLRELCALTGWNDQRRRWRSIQTAAGTAQGRQSRGVLGDYHVVQRLIGPDCMETHKRTRAHAHARSTDQGRSG